MSVVGRRLWLTARRNFESGDVDGSTRRVEHGVPREGNHDNSIREWTDRPQASTDCTTCSVDGCERAADTRGWCGKHYARWRRHGDAQAMLIAEKGNGKPDALGYLRVSVPGHPVAMSNGTAFKHRVVLYDAIGPGPHACNWCERLVEWEPSADDGRRLVVDHIDSDKTNNGLSNLTASCSGCNAWRERREAASDCAGSQTSTDCIGGDL